MTGPGVNVLITTASDTGRVLIELGGANGAKSAQLFVGGQPAAGLRARIGCRPDSSGRYFAVTASTFVLLDELDREPLFRLEYLDDMRTAPSCHWQVHAERGALTHLLTLSGKQRPHQLSALHIPVGGARLRPCLEDFLQFAIDECGVDTVAGYEDAIKEGRESWRRKQIRTAVRDVPDEAADVLATLGYVVTPPAAGHAPTRIASLHNW